MDNPLVSIIILNHNTSHKAVACAHSLLENISYPNFSITVVDNSQRKEEKMKLLEMLPPSVDLLFLKHNRGYTGGNNAGIKHVLEKFKPDYILLMNADTQVKNGEFIEKIINYMEKEKGAGVCGPIVYDEEGKIQNTVFPYPSLRRTMLHWFAFRLFPSLLPHSKKFKNASEVDVLNGVCIMMRKEIFETVGFFDELYFMYIEDVNFQYRARLKGWKVFFLPIPAVSHLQNPNDYSLTSRVSRLLRRNTFLLKLQFEGKIYALLFGIFTILLFFIRAIFFNPRKEFLRFSIKLFKDFRNLFRGYPVTG